MKEYIERAAVLKYSKAILNLAEQRIQSGKAESDVWKAIHQTQEEERREFVSLLENAPAANVVEVRNGRWIFKEYDEMPWCTQAICSECGAVVENNSSLTTESGKKYFLKDNQCCRKCGARMDKEDEHDAD